VIDAADTVDTAQAAQGASRRLKELRRRGPAYRPTSRGGARSARARSRSGCIAAAATGQVYLGLPCVITGASVGGAHQLGEATITHVSRGCESLKEHKAVHRRPA